MNTLKKNLYKQPNVFRCVHDVHQHFRSQLSPFHVLVNKKCYPNGCVYFSWKCKLLAKQKKCFRNFSNVGKECSNCKYFVEEKIHQYPEFIYGRECGAKFLENFDEFQEWIEELRGKRILCEGVVSEVKPEFILYKNNGNFNISLRGFLICFTEGFLDNILFEDKFYLSISASTQNSLLIRDSDSIEFMANLVVDKGRLKFIKSGRFQFYERGKGAPPRKNEFLVTLQTYTIQKNQPTKCLNCSYGQLCDVKTNDPGPKREVICTKGIQDYNHCTIAIPLNITSNSEKCANPQRGCNLPL